MLSTPEPRPAPEGRIAGVTAAAVAIGALACGVCCVLPFALPAAILAVSGGVLAWFGGLYSGMSLLAVAAVLISWGWVGWRSLRARRPPARATVITLLAATAALAAALAWPLTEPVLRSLLRR